jgi:hypothetical protein
VQQFNYYAGKCVVVDFDGDYQTWTYRTDLFEDPTEQKNFKAKYGWDLQWPETFEQLEVSAARIGAPVDYLREGQAVSVEFVEGQATGLAFPGVVEARVAETAPPSHGAGGDNVWKDARLENGVHVKVPPFISPGEMIRVDVETASYVERARLDKKK